VTSLCRPRRRPAAVDFRRSDGPAHCRARSIRSICRGFSSEQILKFTEDCLAPIAAAVTSVPAASAGSRPSGVGDAVAALTAHSHVPPLVLGWLIAALIRLSTGSATVSITTAAGIVAPMIAGMPGVNIELMVIAMGAGSLIFSHVNDSGFWFVKEYFNMTVTETLRTWSVVETVVSIVALGLILLLNPLIQP
jgi:GntP family gluconate:H+ symporter